MQDKYTINEADLERYPALSEQGVLVGDEVEWDTLIVPVSGNGEPWPRDVSQTVRGISFREGGK